MNDERLRAPRLRSELDRNWIEWTLLAWAAAVAYYLWLDWGHVYWLALGDTDDNMRLMQVRALLHGQSWWDLRDYRMNPPKGFNIHWSRLVDLPIAWLILVLRLFTTEFWAQRLACGIAPLLPLSIAMLGVGATVRRLVSPFAWPLAVAFILLCPATMPMFEPMRIDHHGWQLAFLSLTLAGLVDPDDIRGAAFVGLSSAASLTIGLEMLPYCAVAGAILALRWVWDRANRDRLVMYGLTLAGGSAVGFAAFVSDANLIFRCDALTPVWLVTIVAAGLLLAALGLANPGPRWQRLAMALVAAVAIGAGFALLFPQCLGRPEQVSPELAKNWLDNVREAKPIYQFKFRMVLPLAAMPLVGIACTLAMLWRSRARAAAVAWLSVLALGVLGALMLLWEIRAAPAAQMLAVPGAVAMAWIVVPWCLSRRSAFVRVLGTVGAVVLVSGVFAGLALELVPEKPENKRMRTVNHASRFCPTLPALIPLDKLPPQTIFTFVDLGPRVITITHHDAVAGPYHRNGGAILDVQHAFQGSPATFRAIAHAHGATLLLVCPNMAESTVYRARAPGGFYDQLAHGKTFPWLTPIALPKADPLRLWRIG